MAKKKHRTTRSRASRTKGSLTGRSDYIAGTATPKAEGVYENEYAFRHGAWRVRVLRWTPSFYGKLPKEAIEAGRPSAPVSDRFPPSAPSTFSKEDSGSWAAPFQYPHPLTGELTPIA